MEEEAADAADAAGLEVDPEGLPHAATTSATNSTDRVSKPVNATTEGSHVPT